jgi:hypothetical protein
MTTGSGASHELPVGRLANFEDDDTVGMSSLLPRRPPRATLATAPTQPATAPPSPVETPAVQHAVAPTRGGATTAKAVRDAPEKTVGARANRMRSSSMHIRSSLVAQIIGERQQTGRSNGNIIIAALESVHDHLDDLLPRAAEPTGGSLFAARPTRTPRIDEGPHSPLNVRLYENDFEVLDRLVSDFGARSRSHLVDVALAYYYDTTHP